MFRMMMGFQMFLMLVFFIGIQAEGTHAMERCLRDPTFSNSLELGFLELANEEQLDEFCSKMESFFRCIDEVLVEETGMNLEEMTWNYEGTEFGKALSILSNMANLVDDLCTDGNKLRDGYLANSACFSEIDNKVSKECGDLSEEAFDIFKKLETGTTEPEAKYCIDVAYQMGCLGVAVEKECGENGFHVYTEFVKKIGVFKSGVCSAELMNTMMTTLIDSLEMSDAQKRIYRLILELKKRRK